MSEKQVYKLYAMPLSARNISVLETHRFYKINKNYALLYIIYGEAPKQAVEVSESELYRLTDSDREWLRSCNDVLIQETLRVKYDEWIKDIQKNAELLADWMERQVKTDKEGGETT